VRKNLDRDAAIYKMWLSGKLRKQVGVEFEITESAVASAIKRYRKLTGLPNGLKAKGD
jgi:hypothetical protein